MVIAPDGNRIAGRKSLAQRFIELLIDILWGFSYTRHGYLYWQTSAK